MSNAPLKSKVAGVANTRIFGFWVYLMTDLVLFAALFATFAVLRNNIGNGPSGHEIFNLNFVFAETLILLTSSFTCGLAMLAVKRGEKSEVLAWLGVTGLLGLSFLVMEMNEFSHLVRDGNSWRISAFLSSFFTLVGTHGLHIMIGLLWIAVLIIQVMRRGLGPNTIRRLTIFSIFWHFLDIVWIFIFTIVYLMGVARI